MKNKKVIIRTSVPHRILGSPEMVNLDSKTGVIEGEREYKNTKMYLIRLDENNKIVLMNENSFRYED